MVDDEDRGQRRAGAAVGGHRQVDLRHQQHEHDAQRDGRGDNDLDEQVRQVAVAQEVTVLGGEEAPDEHERDDHRNDPVAAGHRLQHGMPAAPGVRCTRRG